MKNIRHWLYRITLLTLVFGTLNVIARSDDDLKRDKSSHPNKVIEFSGVVKGDHVLDMFGGDGYYSELLAYAVGDTGKVVLQNNQAYVAYVGEALESRFQSIRLPNISRLISESDDLKLGNEKFDKIFLVLAFHDFYFEDKNWNVPVAQVMPQLKAALKKGGQILIIDHATTVGHGIRDAKKLHRIAPDFVKAEMKKYGFYLKKESSLLRNSMDDYSINVFNPAVRRKTDRFIFLFEKE